MTVLLEEAVQVKGKPLKLVWWQWVLMIGFYELVVLLTAYKDLLLTGIQPNPVYYLVVPILSIIGATAGGYIASRYFKLLIGYRDVLFITLATNFIGQVMEILFKLIYYYLWTYPSSVYAFLVVVPLATVIPAYLYNRWVKIRFVHGLIIGIAALLGGVFTAAIFISLTGIYTAGS